MTAPAPPSSTHGLQLGQAKTRASAAPVESTTQPNTEGDRQGRTPFLSLHQLYVLSSAVLVLSCARIFYGALRAQTEHVDLWFAPQLFDEFVSGARHGRWSAPLDDVFIHFDFARAAARGYPFEWSEGNGYSSGGTSLIYPFILALGYLLGYRELSLMHWAAIVACVSVFSLLLCARRLFSGLPQVYALLLPLLLLSVGGLNWSLFSGMEVAFFLSVWAFCFWLWDDLMSSIAAGFAPRFKALRLGLACALLVATRPEAAPLVFLLGVSPAFALFGRNKRASALEALLLIGIPGALTVSLHLVANHVLTGDSTAAGGLAKLELHHPYMTSEQIRSAWVSFFRYQIERLTLHHFSAVPGVGAVPWILALLSFVSPKTCRYGWLLWAHILVWSSLVALNGQVRWQNERYTMPNVAWLLMAAALGLGAVLDWARTLKRPLPFVWAAVVSLLTGVYLVAQAPRYRDQIWFFGRASRNILEQHVRTGDYVRAGVTPRPHRVMVSDAGAIPYIADLPAFDLIGLGGYGGLPIARASRQGVGAAVELIEHMRPSERPDLLALYPSWWGNFVLWFGRPIASFPVRGNVIAGGANMVVYRPDWEPLARSGTPFSLAPHEHVTDTLDIADLLSEREHELTLSHPAVGFVDMKMLADPRDPKKDLWDAGRLLTGDVRLTFRLRAEGHQSELAVRVAPAAPASLRLSQGEKVIGELALRPADNWQEVRLPLQDANPTRPFSLQVSSGATLLYHLFVLRAEEGSVVTDVRPPDLPIRPAP